MFKNARGVKLAAVLLLTAALGGCQTMRSIGLPVPPPRKPLPPPFADEVKGEVSYPSLADAPRRPVPTTSTTENREIIEELGETGTVVKAQAAQGFSADSEARLLAVIKAPPKLKPAGAGGAMADPAAAGGL